MKRARILLVAGAALLLAGCAETRSARFGLLAGDEPLVTLVVSEDLQVVSRECLDPSGTRRLLGCRSSRVVVLPGGAEVKVIRIVRYTDALPSELALEIDVHELCHAVAAAQGIEDPCHRGNDGVIQAAGSAPRVWGAHSR